MYYGRNPLHRVAQNRPQRENRLLRSESGISARRIAHSVRHHRPRGRGRYSHQNPRPVRRVHVRRRSLRQEGEGALRRRAHTFGHDKTAARTGQPAHPRRTDQPPRHAHQGHPQASHRRLQRHCDCGEPRPRVPRRPRGKGLRVWRRQSARISRRHLRVSRLQKDGHASPT